MRQEHRSQAIPGEMGGTLIRRWIGFVREQGLQTPLGSQILCAMSGGADSTALATLIALYGRKLGGLAGIIHFNHRWRGSQSDEDEGFVRELGKRWEVPVHVGKAGIEGRAPSGNSAEAVARAQRKSFFDQVLSEYPPDTVILTAHHADDLAETVLWRALTGAAATHGAGILPREGAEVRPLLTTRRSELRQFLAEEGVSWREDSTNSEGELLRTRIRREVTPALDSLFPRWVQHLGAAALAAGGEVPARAAAEELSILAALLGQQGIRARRAHWLAIQGALQGALNDALGDFKTRSLDFEGGWKLTHEADRSSGKRRWILEQNEGL